MCVFSVSLCSEVCGSNQTLPGLHQSPCSKRDYGWKNLLWYLDHWQITKAAKGPLLSAGLSEHRFRGWTNRALKQEWMFALRKVRVCFAGWRRGHGTGADRSCAHPSRPRTPSAWARRSHRHTWTPAARGTRGESDLQHEHAQTQNTTWRLSE